MTSYCSQRGGGGKKSQKIAVIVNVCVICILDWAFLVEATTPWFMQCSISVVDLVCFNGLEVRVKVIHWRRKARGGTEVWEECNFTDFDARRSPKGGSIGGGLNKHRPLILNSIGVEISEEKHVINSSHIRGESLNLLSSKLAKIDSCGFCVLCSTGKLDSASFRAN